MSDPTEIKVSATLILDQIRLMRELYGSAAVDQALASLPKPAHDEITSLLAGGWCSIDAARELKVAVANIVGENPFALQKRVVSVGVERTLNTVWRFVLRRISDEDIAKRTPLLYSRSFNHGKMTLVEVKENEAVFELHGWPTIPEFDLAGIVAGTETVLGLAGRAEAHAVAVRRPGSVRVRAVWKGRAK